MVRFDGRLKVLDFGLAKMMNTPALPKGERDIEKLTQHGQILGTVPYMSPEQAEGASLDERTDGFSLGVILYQMLTGEAPFRGASAAAILSAILRDAPEPVSDLNSDVPPQLSRVVMRCLSKESGQRYRTAGTLKRAIVRLERAFARKT